MISFSHWLLPACWGLWFQNWIYFKPLWCPHIFPGICHLKVIMRARWWFIFEFRFSKTLAHSLRSALISRVWRWSLEYINNFIRYPLLAPSTWFLWEFMISWGFPVLETGQKLGSLAYLFCCALLQLSFQFSHF